MKTGFQVILMLLGGIGLFVFALNLIEQAVKGLAGRKFKLFIQSLTKNKILAVLGSAALAALLQGSSVMLVMVLALVGAGVLSLSGAMAFVLGANIGTTFDSWVIAMLGFKVNVDAFAFPAIIVATIFKMLPAKEKLKEYSNLLFGFGLLFVSVSLMKQSVEAPLNYFDFTLLQGVSMWKFVIAGTLITILIQSSLATMTLALSALHCGAIDFNTAAAIVIGSEVGTTIKIFLGTMDGQAAKKRLALGNFIFNVLTALFAYFFLNKFVYFVKVTMGVGDPLTGLVAFQSTVNIVAVLFFLPFLEVFARFLDQRYRDNYDRVTTYISKDDLQDPLTAAELFAKDAGYFLHVSMVFNLELMGLQSSGLHLNPTCMEVDEKRKLFSKSAKDQYLFLKDLQGELQLLYLQLRNTNLSAEQIHRLDHIISAVRSAMHASKNVKDVESNIKNLLQSSNDVKFNFYKEISNSFLMLYVKLEDFTWRKSPVSFDELKTIYDEVMAAYEHFLHEIYFHAAQGALKSSDFTTIMNFNREMFTSNKALIFAVKDFVLNHEDAERFNELPVYKT